MRNVLSSDTEFEVEHWFGTRLIADPNAVASEAQDIADPHGCGSQDIPLNGNAVAVTAGDLQYDAEAGAREKRADAHRRHVAVGTRRIGSIDRIRDIFQRLGGSEHIARIGRIRRVQLGGHCEPALAEHPFKN